MDNTIKRVEERDGVMSEVTYNEVACVALTTENQVNTYLSGVLEPFSVDDTTIEDIVAHLNENNLLAE